MDWKRHSPDCRYAPKPTAYEQSQAALVRRIEALERLVALHKVVFERLGATYEACDGCEGGVILTLSPRPK